MNPLTPLREEIDAVDLQLLSLFEKRMALCEQVAQVKLQQNIPLTDPTRENEILKKRIAQLQDASLSGATESLFRFLMHVSKDRQSQFIAPSPAQPCKKDGVSVAFQGISGAYGEEAMLGYFGQDIQAFPNPTFEDVFKSVWRGDVRFGVVPIENSSTSTIAAVLDLFEQYPLHIIGEHVLRIEHNLLGIPGATLEQIQTVVSHEQGLLQCAHIIRDHGWATRPMLNTAIAAESVHRNGDLSTAAIASRYAAQCYGLNILLPDINDKAENYTRFWILSATPSEQPGDKISLSFTLRHEVGTLYRALTPFATRRLNLTRIESRPAAASFEYRFFVDFEGDLHTEEVSRALIELEAQCTSVRVLGNYASAGRNNHA